VQLEHSFTVPTGVDQAWSTLLDIERIAPCMPGAAIESVDGDDFTGTVKVRLGPIGLTYKGKASFVTKDAQAHRVVIDARGRDARGNGTASATVTATLQENPAGHTEVIVLTDLNITGKPAQFGRGVMVDVGNKLIGQFADCLAGKLSETPDQPADAAKTTADEPIAAPLADDRTVAPRADEPAAGEAGPATEAPIATGAPAAEPPKPTPVPAHTSTPRPGPAEVQPIDLLGSAGPAVLKRLVPVVGALALVAAAVLVFRRRRS